MSAAPRRLLLDLGNLAADGGGLRAAAELGALLGLDLVGLFVEDEQVAHLAGAREYRLPGGPWSAAEPARILEEMAGLADRARRRLEAEVAALGHAARFERLRGDPAAALVARAAAQDILAIGCATVSDLACRAVADIRRAAARCEASVLLMPPRLARARGDVAVLAPLDGRTGLDIAGALARATGERLRVLPEPAATPAVAGDWRRTPDAIEAALTSRPARLLVLPHEAEATAGMAARLATRLRIPVLMAEPACEA
jgi:hypothetical protein